MPTARTRPETQPGAPTRTRTQTQTQAREHRIALSQNFLQSPRLVDRLLDQATIGSDDLVIEIGAGRGIVTGRLAARCRQVLAVEKDPWLVEELRVRFSDASNVALFAADFLDFPLPHSPYKVFANIPFNITAAIVGKLTSGSSPPVDAYLAMQREAAERFLGQPRTTLVAAMLHPWFEPRIVHRFRPADFSPAPGVDVVLLRLQRRESPCLEVMAAEAYGDFVAHLFSAWKPTVREALHGIVTPREISGLEGELGRSLTIAPRDLPLDAWLALFRAMQAKCGYRLEQVTGARARLERQQAGLQKEHRTRRTRPRERSGSAR